MSPVWQFILAVPPLFVAVILHEVAHGWAAEKLGDPTARSLGRISFNPLVHIDLFMTILLPAILIMSNIGIVFGGAKPVPVNPIHFKDPRRGMLWVALAGPLVNFLLVGLSYIALIFILSLSLPPFLLLLLAGWCAYSILINLVLGLFNLCPVPPLDGGRIMVGILPLGLAKAYAKLERVGLLIVVALIFMGVPQKVLFPVIQFVAVQLEQLSFVG